MYKGAGSEAERSVRYEAEEIYTRSSSAIFFVRSLGEYDTIRSVGTGVIISENGYAFTAYHVTKNAIGLEAVLEDGRIIKGVEVVAYDENNDVSLLRIPLETMSEKSFTAMPIRSDEELRHGEHVFAMGYPLKGTPIITEGIINSPDAEINGQSRVLVSTQIVSGMSGGPIVDQEGRVAGIISGSLRTMPGIHLAVDMGAASKLLKE
jgi:serine protease Do